MKLLITSTGDTLESEVDPRFGRAKKFILFDTETEEFSVIDNKQVLNMPSGAGIQASQNVVNSGADVLITSNCGPKAYMVLSTAGIKVYLGAKGSIKNAISDFKEGKLKGADAANVEGHWI